MKIINLKKLIIILFSTINFFAQAQEFKYTSCNNYNFIQDQGMTINEAIIGQITVNLNDSTITLKSYSPDYNKYSGVISVTEEMEFKIVQKTEEIFNNKKTLYITVECKKPTKNLVEPLIISLTPDILSTSFETLTNE